jgi:hypothetical protein
MVSALVPLRLKDGPMAKAAGNRPVATDVGVDDPNFPNTARYRMPWAVSRDLQTAAINNKELYFRVTDPLLKNTANGGAVKSGTDFEFSNVGGTVIPYVIKSYDGVAGTLMGVMKPAALAGSTAFTRGYLYFSSDSWTTSRQDSEHTFPNATSVLFLPSRVDQSSAELDFNRDLPTADKVIVNPGAQCDGDSAGNDYMTRNLTGNCGDFLISFLAEASVNNSDNSPISFGAATGGATSIFIRHLFADAAADTDTSPHHRNAWRTGFSTSEGNSFYETADGIADTSLQHIVMRRVSGSHLELYVNGVLVPWAFTQTPGGTPQSAKIDFTNLVLYVGRGAVGGSRFWNGYLDCFKFFKDDAKTAGWALAEYSNLNDIDGGVIFGTPETKTTSSVWGETIKVQADQLSFVDFKADKYSSTLAGTISLDSTKPFDNPLNGTLTDRGSNNVRYTNTKAVDPDNAGKVHLTNGVGNVIIPVRAHVIITAPPPPTGYYKIPNHKLKNKTAVACGNRNALIQAIADFKSGAHNYSAVTHYINITGDCGARATRGADIVVNTGGTKSDPLVITMDTGAGTDSSWSSRPTIYNSSLVITAPWVWLYALQLEARPRSVDGAPYTAGNTGCVTPQADNTYVSACRMDALIGIWGDGRSDTYNGSNFSFNRFEIAQSNADSKGGGNSSAAVRNTDGSGVNATAHQLTIVYNYMIESTGSVVANSASWRGFSFGNGHGGAGRLRTIGTEIAYNYFNGNFSHAIEIKRMPDKIHHNHMINGRNGPYTRGENAYGPTNPTASDPRPLYFANRTATVNGANINCGHADFISHWVLNKTASGNAEFDLFAPGAQAGKDIAGASSCRLVSCKGNLIIGDATFEATSYTYGNISDITISNHLSGTIQDTARNSVGFSPYPPGPGTATGTHTNMTENTIRRQDAILSGLPVVPEDPPILSTTLTGPGAAGKTWDQ